MSPGKGFLHTLKIEIKRGGKTDLKEEVYCEQGGGRGGEEKERPDFYFAAPPPPCAVLVFLHSERKHRARHRQRPLFITKAFITES